MAMNANPEQLENTEVFYTKASYGFSLKSKQNPDGMQDDYRQPDTPMKKVVPRMKMKDLDSSARRLFDDGTPTDPKNSINNLSANGFPQMGIGPGPFKLILNPTTKKIEAHPMAGRNRFHKEFSDITMIGEGSFGIAYKVVSHPEGGIHRAIKK